MNQLLKGLRVVEQCGFISGPMAGMLLADLGAEVIKIEQPKVGDPFRSFGGDPLNAHFQAYNRNKLSIALDTQVEEDRAIFDQLLGRADVYLHNFRPETAERLHVGASRLMALNEKLVYCAISGFGPDGPAAGRPAYDTVAQAMGGLMHLLLDPESPRIMGPAIADTVTGQYAAYGVLAALFERSRTGKGRVVEVSMLEAIAHFNIDAFANLFQNKIVENPFDRSRGSQAFILTCSDGRRLALHLSSPKKFWDGLIKATGRPDLMTHPDYIDRTGRMRNQEALAKTLQETFMQEDLATWCDRLTKLDVPHSPVYDCAQARQDPQFRHLGIEVEVKGAETLEGLSAVRNPIRVDRQCSTYVRSAPQLDADREQVLRLIAG